MMLASVHPQLSVQGMAAAKLHSDPSPTQAPLKLPEAPAVLVQGGQTKFGVFGSPFGLTNPLDATTAYGGVPVARAVLNLRLKEWQAVQAGNERFFILAVIYNSKVLGLVQLKVWDRKLGRKFAYETFVPPWQAHIAPSLGETASTYSGGGWQAKIRAQVAASRLTVDFTVPASGALPAASLKLNVDWQAAPWLAVSLPFDSNRGMVSHKVLAPARGELTLGGETHHLDSAWSILDDHKGFYPYVMKYDWVTAAGIDEQGIPWGVNLTRNQALFPEKYNENCFWKAGRVWPLPPVSFSRPDGIAGPWQIKSPDRAVEVSFETVIPGRVDLQALFMRSDYHGPFGTLSGHISVGSKTYSLEGLPAMGEKMYLRA